VVGTGSSKPTTPSHPARSCAIVMSCGLVVPGWFEEGWPQDPRLHPFRDAVWELSRDGKVVAYCMTEVIPMRSLPRFWVKREWLWYQVHWLDGRRERPQEDYGPGWFVVTELEQGMLASDDDSHLDASPVEGARRDELWARYGPGAHGK
jgi:hypothetical protein